MVFVNLQLPETMKIKLIIKNNTRNSSEVLIIDRRKTFKKRGGENAPPIFLFIFLYDFFVLFVVSNQGHPLAIFVNFLLKDYH